MSEKLEKIPSKRQGDLLFVEMPGVVWAQLYGMIPKDLEGSRADRMGIVKLADSEHTGHMHIATQRDPDLPIKLLSLDPEKPIDQTTVLVMRGVGEIKHVNQDLQNVSQDLQESGHETIKVSENVCVLVLREHEAGFDGRVIPSGD